MSKVSTELIKLVKLSLESDLTPMQKTIMMNVLNMLGGTLCFEIDKCLSKVDSELNAR